MTTSRDFAGDPPGAAPARRWGPVLGIMAAIITTTVLAGLVLSILFVPIGLLLDHPGLAWLFNVPPGLLAGLVLGLLLAPTRQRLPVYLVASEGLTAAAVVVLQGLAPFRLPDPAEGPERSSILLGVVVTVGLQSMLAVGLWLRKVTPVPAAQH